jgi:hypothetical protein
LYRSIKAMGEALMQTLAAKLGEAGGSVRVDSP